MIMELLVLALVAVMLIVLNVLVQLLIVPNVKQITNLLSQVILVLPAQLEHTDLRHLIPNHLA
jgi:hypothetical protein